MKSLLLFCVFVACTCFLPAQESSPKEVKILFKLKLNMSDERCIRILSRAIQGEMRARQIARLRLSNNLLTDDKDLASLVDDIEWSEVIIENPLPYPPSGKVLDYDPKEYIRIFEPNCNDIRRWQIENGVNIDNPGRFMNRKSKEIRTEPPVRFRENVNPNQDHIEIRSEPPERN